MARMTNQEMQRSLMLKGVESLLQDNSAFRKFMWTIMVEAGIFYPTYSRVSPYATSFMEGRRALGLEVLHMLKEVRPDILGLLEREGNLFHQAAKPPTDEDEDASAYTPDPASDDGDPDVLS